MSSRPHLADCDTRPVRYAQVPAIRNDGGVQAAVMADCLAHQRDGLSQLDRAPAGFSALIEIGRTPSPPYALVELPGGRSGDGLQRMTEGRDRSGEAGLRRLDAQRLPDYRDRLFRAACAICGSRDDAEDLVQDTFARVLRRPRFLRHDDDLGYLLKVLRNTWINSRVARERQPRTVLLDEAIEFVPDPAGDPGVSVPEIRAVYELVHKLSPPLRDTLVAVDVVGLSYKQAAKALGTKEGTVMSRLHRARSRVAEALEREDEAEVH